MKLTGLLKDKVDAVESKEDKKAIIAEDGIELTDDELEGVAGGYNYLGNDEYDDEYDIEDFSEQEEPITSGGFMPFFL